MTSQRGGQQQRQSTFISTIGDSFKVTADQIESIVSRTNNSETQKKNASFTLEFLSINIFFQDMLVFIFACQLSFPLVNCDKIL